MTRPRQSRAARRFAVALRDSMARAGVCSVDLQTKLGISHNAVYCWRAGKGFPTLPLVTALAAHLEDDRLLELALRLRAKRCAVCSARFVDAGSQMKARYCSKACRNAQRLMLDQQRAVMSATMTTQRLHLFQEAVDRYCRGCEPAGICLTPWCDLRSVSPLPLVTRAVG